MPKRIVPLTDVQVRNAKPKEKDYKLPDGYGLYLLVTKTGGRLWRFNFIFDNKPNQLSLGTYPEITLAEARQRREDARKLLAHGISPGEARKAEKQSQTQETETFEAIALEWYNRQVPVWAATHAATVIARLKRDVFTRHFTYNSITSCRSYCELILGGKICPINWHQIGNQTATIQFGIRNG